MKKKIPCKFNDQGCDDPECRTGLCQLSRQRHRRAAEYAEWQAAFGQQWLIEKRERIAREWLKGKGHPVTPGNISRVAAHPKIVELAEEALRASHRFLNGHR
jgi:hypothetical protein